MKIRTKKYFYKLTAEMANIRNRYEKTKDKKEREKLKVLYNYLYGKREYLSTNKNLKRKMIKHANDNYKRSHANDNNQNVLSSVKSRRKRQTNKKSRINFKIRYDGIYSLPSDLRGLPNNKWGGHKPSSQTNVRGTFGAANAGRILSPEEYADDTQRYINTSCALVAKERAS